MQLHANVIFGASCKNLISSPKSYMLLIGLMAHFFLNFYFVANSKTFFEKHGFATFAHHAAAAGHFAQGPKTCDNAGQNQFLRSAGNVFGAENVC